MLLDGEPRKATQKQVEIHIFGHVAHSLYTGRQASFDTPNSVSEISTTHERRYLPSPAIATGYSSPLARRRLVNWRNTFGKVILASINNPTFVGSLEFHSSLWMYLMAGICARGFWRIRSPWRWDRVWRVSRRIRPG